MTPEIAWQIALTLGVAFGGSYLGSRITVAKLEVEVDHLKEEHRQMRETMSEHEGRLGSHDTQLAMLDRSGGVVR